jgi:hypothetical protein
MLGCTTKASGQKRWRLLQEWEVLEHPRHSPDLAPSGIHLFVLLKQLLIGQRFATMVTYNTLSFLG